MVDLQRQRGAWIIVIPEHSDVHGTLFFRLMKDGISNSHPDGVGRIVSRLQFGEIDFGVFKEQAGRLGTVHLAEEACIEITKPGFQVCQPTGVDRHYG
jgi:hypothetical protein